MDFTGAILTKLSECPLLKKQGVKTIGFAGMDAKKRSVSILNTKGELVTEEHVDGGCEMQFPFVLLYRSPGIDTGGKLAAQSFIDEVPDFGGRNEILFDSSGFSVTYGVGPAEEQYLKFNSSGLFINNKRVLTEG